MSECVASPLPWRVVAIQSREDLERHMEPWRAFQWSRPQGASFYNDPDRIDQWLEEFPQTRPLIQLVYCGEKIVAVAPLVADRSHVQVKLGPLKSPRIHFAGAHRMGDEFVFASEIDQTLCLRHIFSSLSQVSDLQAIYLRDVDMSSGEWDFFRSPSLARLGFACINPRWRAEPSHSISIRNSFSDYEASLSRNGRQQLRKKRRRLFKEFPNAQVDVITAPEQVPQFLDRLDAIYQKCWQGRQSTREGHRRNLPRQRNRFEWIASRGWLRAYLLADGAQPLAYVIGYQYGERYDAQEAGYDPHFEPWSTGRVLWSCLIQDLHEKNRPARLRFGWGDFPYKRTLSTESFPAAELFLVRRNRVRWMLRTQRAINGLMDYAVRPLARRARLIRGSTQRSSEE